MSVVPNAESSWGHAAARFADAISFGQTDKPRRSKHCTPSWHRGNEPPKKVAREGLEESVLLLDKLRTIYGMDVVNL
jgi:hypothetical protein